MLRSIVAAITVILPSLVIAQPASAPRPAITGISHVTLFADDIPRSEQFYGKLLGWEQVPSNAAKPGVRFYANHSQYVELVSPPSAGLADRLDLVAFSTNDAEALRKYLGRQWSNCPAVSYNRGGREPKLPRPGSGRKQGRFYAGRQSPACEPASASESVSSRIIHAGYVVRNRAALNHFYKDRLGFHLYWQGGNPPDRVDWVMMQVPNGTDWIEDMLDPPANPSWLS